MRYAIIIPTFNQADYTIRCLASIKIHSDDYVVIWVDDASTTEDYNTVHTYLEQHQIPFHSVRNEKNLGFVQSVNIGLQEALKTAAEYIVIQNNDTIVFPQWLERYTWHLEQDARLGAVGPVTNQRTGQSPHEISFLHNLPDLEQAVAQSEEDTIHEVLEVTFHQKSLRTLARLGFFSVMLRRSVVEEIGLLDENYGFGYYDDDDYCERIIRAGHNLAIALDVYVHHALGVSAPTGVAHQAWVEKRKVITAHNKAYFEKKFGYDSDDTRHASTDPRVKEIRQFRLQQAAQAKIMELTDRIAVMEQSHFWRLRSAYLALKKNLGL